MDSDGGKGGGKSGGFSFPRRQRSRIRDNDRGRRDTSGSNTRSGERLEALSRNPSSRDLAAETKTTEQSKQDGVPEAAVGKITSPSGRGRGSSSGDGSLRRNRDRDRDGDGGKGSGKGGGYSFPR